jgi:hypothetical protein
MLKGVLGLRGGPLMPAGSVSTAAILHGLAPPKRDAPHTQIGAQV